jgi:hypothetical protein
MQGRQGSWAGPLGAGLAAGTGPPGGWAWLLGWLPGLAWLARLAPWGWPGRLGWPMGLPAVLSRTLKGLGGGIAQPPVSGDWCPCCRGRGIAPIPCRGEGLPDPL